MARLAPMRPLGPLTASLNVDTDVISACFASGEGSLTIIEATSIVEHMPTIK
jgi:hypothetical protein